MSKKPIDWAVRLREQGLMAEDDRDGWRHGLQFVIVFAAWFFGLMWLAPPVYSLGLPMWLFVLFISLIQAVSLVAGLILTLALGIVEEL